MSLRGQKNGRFLGGQLKHFRKNKVGGTLMSPSIKQAKLVNQQRILLENPYRKTIEEPSQP
jgi:hypothetical protein